MGAAESEPSAEGSGRRIDAEADLNLPPGFRFHPMDDELMVYYLCPKVAGQPQPVPIIAEVDLYKFNPWDLPAKALFGRWEWYFFTPRDRKYPNGSLPNRAAGGGYWKATGADKPITHKETGRTMGIKKALVFYSGRAPSGVKTDWIMHEYRIADADRSPGKKGSQKLDEWVLCRLYNKKKNWEKVKVETKVHGMAEAPRHHGRRGEVMDALATATMSDSLQTHDPDIDTVSRMQEMQARDGVMAVKEDNEWFTNPNIDELQACYMGQMVNQVVPWQDSSSYMQLMSTPQMRMWHRPPF